MLAFAGVTVIDCNAADVTTTMVEPTTALRVAVIVGVPTATADARPALDTVASVDSTTPT